VIREYKNIVVGSSLEAVLFAFVNKYPIFFTEPEPPLRFDYFSADLDFSFMQIPATFKQVKSFDDEKLIGIPKQQLWNIIIFFLGIDGLVPLSNFCNSMRYDGVNLMCYNDYAKIAQVSFDTCHYFHDLNTTGLVKTHETKSRTYICYDYIAFHKGGKHEIDYISTGDDFVSQIWFYSSDRICGDTGVKDACVLSRLTHEQLDDFSYSQTMSKFKALSIMYENGMNGPLRGYNSKGEPRHSKFKTSLITREKRLLARPDCVPMTNVCEPLENENALLPLLKNINYNRYGL